MLEEYRSYLQLLAELHTAAGLRRKIDLSGVVQQTIWEGTCQMTSEDNAPHELVAAQLRKILMRNLTDEVRRVTAARRDVRREKSLSNTMEHSSAKLAEILHADESSPSQKMIRFERVLRLAEELEKLPEGERLVLVARYLREQPLAEISSNMNKTKPAVAGLLQRGLRRLRIRMSDGGSNS